MQNCKMRGVWQKVLNTASIFLLNTSDVFILQNVQTQCRKDHMQMSHVDKHMVEHCSQVNLLGELLNRSLGLALIDPWSS